MGIRIGHASIDENGRAQGGAAGDQTAKEVCIRNWYSGGWNVLLRPKDEALAASSAKACEDACANKNVGYDQFGRNTLFQQAREVDFDLSKILIPCECDCSSLMHVCAIAGGARLTYGANGYTTRTMVSAFAQSGDYEKLTASAFLEDETQLRRGDILVKEGSHTVMVLDDGQKAKEPENRISSSVTYEVLLPLVKQGDRGEVIRSVQQLLHLRSFDPGDVDGIFGKKTASAVRRLQEKAKIEVDGKVGGDTWTVLLKG